MLMDKFVTYNETEKAITTIRHDKKFDNYRVETTAFHGMSQTFSTYEEACDFADEIIEDFMDLDFGYKYDEVLKL